MDYRDFAIAVGWGVFDPNPSCTIYHRSEAKILELWEELEAWASENSVFRGKQFTYPNLEKPKMAKASFMNDVAKRLLEENTVLFFRHLARLRQKNLRTSRGIILYGNPGNGKTSICRWISKNLPGVTRIWVTAWEMCSQNISHLFEIARALSPAIIFMEDIDTAGISRNITGRLNPLLGRLLKEMDGIQKNDGIVVIATTNNIWALDEALANRPGRFDLKIRIGNPHQRVVKKITGRCDRITLAEAFRRKEEKIYYEKILGKKYRSPAKRNSVHYIG